MYKVVVTCNVNSSVVPENRSFKIIKPSTDWWYTKSKLCHKQVLNAEDMHKLFQVNITLRLSVQT